METTVANMGTLETAFHINFGKTTDRGGRTPAFQRLLAIHAGEGVFYFKHTLPGTGGGEVMVKLTYGQSHKFLLDCEAEAQNRHHSQRDCWMPVAIFVKNNKYQVVIG